MSELRDDPGWRRYEKHMREKVIPNLVESAVFVSLIPSMGDVDVQFATEIGYAICLDKPIIVVAGKDRPVSAKLRAVADEVIEDVDLDTADGRAQFLTAMRQVQDRLT